MSASSVERGNRPLDDWERKDFVAELTEEREYSTRLAGYCDEMADRLGRLEDHLGTLAKFAADLIKDPWPKPTAPKATRRRKGGA